MKHLFTFLLDKHAHEWDHPTISPNDLKSFGQYPEDVTFFQKVQGPDQEITDTNPAKLSRNGIEEIYSAKKDKYRFIVNEQIFNWPESKISYVSILKAAGISDLVDLFLKVQGKDELIAEGSLVDLAPYAIEEFYTKTAGPKLVSISIDTNPYQVSKGDHKVADLMKLANITPGYEFSMLSGSQSKLLNPHDVIKIKGGEEFFSNVPGGTSS